MSPKEETALLQFLTTMINIAESFNSELIMTYSLMKGKGVNDYFDYKVSQIKALHKQYEKNKRLFDTFVGVVDKLPKTDILYRRAIRRIDAANTYIDKIEPAYKAIIALEHIGGLYMEPDKLYI